MKKLFLVSVLLLTCSIGRTQLMENLTSKFSQGYFYTWQGDKKAGEIKVICVAKFGTLPHNSFYFKVGDGKQDRKTTADAMSFVIGTDSFIVVRNIKHGEHELTEDFAHVDAVEGDITTVTHYTIAGGGGDAKADGLTLYVKKGFTYTSKKAAEKAK